MRNTTALPVRTTPHASANTLGRPSNTNPTTPSGARFDSTDHWVFHACDHAVAPAGRVTPATQPGDHVRPHAGVEHQPRRRASRPGRRRDIVAAFASAIERTRRRRPAPRRTGRRSPRSPRRRTASAAKAIHRSPVTAASTNVVHRGRNVEQGPGRLHDDQRSPGRKASASSASTRTARSPPNGIS